MYRILEVVSQRENYETLYKYMTTVIDGITQPREFATETELDSYVESMLNDKGYSKADFIIAEIKDYNIVADIAENEETIPIE